MRNNENLKKYEYLKKFEIRLALILLVYLVIGILIIKFYQFQINNDGISYIKIANNYISGSFYDAAEGYHSPMISWLLVPFLLFSKNPAYSLYAAKIMSLIVGFFTIIGVGLLSSRFELEEKLRVLVLVLTIPMVLYFAFSVITPDILLVCFLVYYLYLVFDPDYSNKLSSALFCGFLGALAYFTKSYAFPFIIVHFSIFNALHYLKDRSSKKNILRNLVMGFLVFFLISGLWIGVISSKEGKITYSTAGSFNYELIGPESQGWGNPYLGESPVEVTPWNPLATWSNFNYQLTIIWNNCLQIIGIITSFTYFSIIIIIIYLLLLMRPQNQILKDDKILFPLITIIIYAGGFTPILVEERYLWVVYVLLLLMGAYLLTILFKNDFRSLVTEFNNAISPKPGKGAFKENKDAFNRNDTFKGDRDTSKGITPDGKFFTPKKKLILTIFFAVSFIVLPVNYFTNNVDQGWDVYDLSKSVKGIPENSKIASNDLWQKSAYLSYYWDSEFIGETKPYMEQNELNNLLKTHGIDYYLVWGNENFNSSGYVDVTPGKIEGLKVYKVGN